MSTKAVAVHSVVKSLFAGYIPADLLFPFPEIKDEEKETISAFLDSFRQFAEAKIHPEKIDREHRVPEEVIKGLGELGLMGMAIPEEYGGFGFSASAYCRVMEEVGRTDASVGVVVGAHQSIGLKALILFGSEAQKKKWLPRLASGEVIAAFALTEPEAGSDAAGIKMTAEYDSAREQFVLSGTKQWISNGGIASFFTVFAKDTSLPAKDEHKRITAFIVTSDLPGFSRGKEEEKLGLRGSSTCQIHCDNVRVPAANVLGERGQGFRIAVEVLNTGRTSLGAGCVGGSKEMIRHALLHATQRRQFGQPIANFEMLRHKFARMIAATYALESMVYLTTGLIDAGLRDYSLEGACCKVFGTETVWQNINDALQIAGGNGFMAEYPYERALRDARVNMIFEGTNEILRMYIALAGMKERIDYMKGVGRALKAPLSSLGVLSQFAGRRIKRVVAPQKLARVVPELQSEADAIVKYAGALGSFVESLLSKHGKAIVEREYHHERLADAAIDLYASTAVLSRVTSAIASRGAEKAADEMRTARLFLNAARRRIVGNLKRIDRNRDDDRTGLSKRAYQNLKYPFGYWE